MILVEGLSKTYKVARRASGLRHAVKALFSREYTVIEALRDVSFTIRPGEIVGYIGPNGAGKSTTIKIMCGILMPDRGTCRILGYVPWKERVPYVRHIGVVFGQRSQLWWDVPVMDSFELLRDIYAIPPKTFRDNVELLTEALELRDLLHTPVRQLSLGQRMRCEIAASLLHDPAILFLDEPTIGLDALSKLAVRQFIKTINKEKGTTVILTTHDMNDIETLAGRILLIGGGSLLYDGTLAELRGRFDGAKRIVAEYRPNPHPPRVHGAALLEWAPERAVLSVDPRQTSVTEVLDQLSRQVELLDVAIEAMPVEEIIVRLYKAYQL